MSCFRLKQHNCRHNSLPILPAAPVTIDNTSGQSLRILSKSMFISSRLKRSSICILRNCILLHCVCSVKNGAMRRQMWFSRPYCTISSSLRRSVWLRNNIQLTFKVLNNFRRLFSSSINISDIPQAGILVFGFSGDKSENHYKDCFHFVE